MKGGGKFREKEKKEAKKQAGSLTRGNRGNGDSERRFTPEDKEGRKEDVRDECGVDPLMRHTV
jgi:hypothetical protein